MQDEDSRDEASLMTGSEDTAGATAARQKEHAEESLENKDDGRKCQNGACSLAWKPARVAAA